MSGTDGLAEKEEERTPIAVIALFLGSEGVTSKCVFQDLEAHSADIRDELLRVVGGRPKEE